MNCLTPGIPEMVYLAFYTRMQLKSSCTLPIFKEWCKFRNFRECFMLSKIKPKGNSGNSLSLSDEGKSYGMREFLRGKHDF